MTKIVVICILVDPFTAPLLNYEITSCISPIVGSMEATIMVTYMASMRILMKTIYPLPQDLRVVPTRALTILAPTSLDLLQKNVGVGKIEDKVKFSYLVAGYLRL